MKKSFLFITCEEAQHICDKSQYGEATLWERIKLTIRLLWCRVTQNYTKNNNKLTKLITKKQIPMDASAKENLKSAFEQELAKHQ